MFDNHQNPPSNNPPTNLPLGEPDDMFANADSVGADFASPVPTVPVSTPAVAPVAELESSPAQMPATALDAGVLRPRNILPANTPVADEDIETGLPIAPTMPPATGMFGQAPRSTVQSSMTPQPQGVAMGSTPEDNVLRDPMGGRKVWVTIIVLVSLGLVGAAGAWVYFNYINPNTTTVLPNNSVVVSTSTVVTPTQITEENTAVDTNTTSTDNQILFGDPVLDTDSDGLDDEYEKANGTDMLLWDTDSDTLSDGDEILTWKTDPKKSDTDGDTYQDGVEIRNGYNPRGDGKLFPTPSSTTENS